MLLLYILLNNVRYLCSTLYITLFIIKISLTNRRAMFLKKTLRLARTGLCEKLGCH
jgi:hypothetical protein